MKIIENITLYRCDFCKKTLRIKHAMEQHEKKCNSNPSNMRPCLSCCPHLERAAIKIDTGISEYGSFEPIYKDATAFYCQAKKILLLHPKTQWLEGKQNLSWVTFGEDEVEQFDMPLQCDIYDNQKIAIKNIW